MLTHLLEAKTNHPMTSKLVWYPFKITRRADRCNRAYVFFHATHLGSLITFGVRIVFMWRRKEIDEPKRPIILLISSHSNSQWQ